MGLGCFNYSHEENTHAFQLEDDVPEEEKQRRSTEIMEVQSNFLGVESRQGREYLSLYD